MRVHDASARALNQAPQRERGNDVELSVRRESHDLDAPIGRTARQLILAPRDDHRAVATITHPRRQPQHLTLPAAPATLRVDVQNRQQARAPLMIIS
jgi:hypothetical protein